MFKYLKMFSKTTKRLNYFFSEPYIDNKKNKVQSHRITRYEQAFIFKASGI